MNQRLRTREWSGVDYYAELGITADASRAAVDEAYRRQAKALHPDRNPDATAEDRFKRLTAAYEVLRDPVTRQAYDDFRFRVDAGLLYAEPAPGRRHRAGLRATPAGAVPAGRRSARPAGRCRPGSGSGSAGRCRRRARRGRSGRSSGRCRRTRAGDTNLAVQITLGIMAAKLLACGVIVIKYPELRARWHRPPGSRSARGTGLGRPRSRRSGRKLT